MDNMSIYNKARSVPDDALKPIQAGRLKGMSDINPVYRIKRLTEIFGPCGVGWWYEITDKSIIFDEMTNQKCAFVDVLLFFKDPETGEASHGIPGTGGASFVAQERSGPYMSDECYKMALTDALSVACKSLGIAADVYYAKDRTKYTASTVEEPKKASKADLRVEKVCESCGKLIVPVKNKDGETKRTVEQIADYSQKTYSKMLCFDCIKNLESVKNGA